MLDPSSKKYSSEINSKYKTEKAMNIMRTVSLWNKMKPGTTNVIYIVKCVLRNKMGGGNIVVKS